MGVSRYAQETICYMGQHLVFKEAEEVLQRLSGCAIDAKQIERLCHSYGQWLEEQDLNDIQVQGYQAVAAAARHKRHYVSVDGSMYLTRQEGWKEVKLGRIYKQEDLIATTKDRCILMASQYVAHLGNSKAFLPKMEYYIEHLHNKVFIADGAAWIWNWVEDSYPDSTQIVDYFHAKEHLCEFAKEYFQDPTVRTHWIETQSQRMINEGISPVIEELKKLPGKQEKLTQIVGYYQHHEQRMQYHTFRQKGLLIGSGAIEAAHKDVLQKRLKLSGQRWTKQGLQQMAQLRVAYKSGKWNRIVDFCRNAA